jgi:hypothetical protein
LESSHLLCCFFFCFRITFRHSLQYIIINVRIKINKGGGKLGGVYVRVMGGGGWFWWALGNFLLCLMESKKMVFGKLFDNINYGVLLSLWFIFLGLLCFAKFCWLLIRLSLFFSFQLYLLLPWTYKIEFLFIFHLYISIIVQYRYCQFPNP